MRRRGPEMEWWVEWWNWEVSPPKWEFCSFHESKDEAFAAADYRHQTEGSVWRVVEIARYPLKEFR